MSDYMQQRVEVAEDYCPTCGYVKCRCAETIFTGRYDHQSEIERALHHAFQVQQACRAIGHRDGKLSYDAARNVLTCEHCKYEMNLNCLVHPALRVPRQVA